MPWNLAKAINQSSVSFPESQSTSILLEMLGGESHLVKTIFEQRLEYTE